MAKQALDSAKAANQEAEKIKLLEKTLEKERQEAHEAAEKAEMVRLQAEATVLESERLRVELEAAAAAKDQAIASEAERLK